MGSRLKLEKMGSIRQAAGIRRITLDDGASRGVRCAQFRNGSGLDFTVNLDRGMDIGEASFNGRSLCWLSPCSFRRPENFVHDGIQWLRNWGGGLLTGCGLRNVGAPCELAGEKFGLHGRLSNTPAESVSCSEDWIDGRYVLSAKGSMREVSVFGEHLLITRSISCAMGDNTIEIRDRVENCGFRPSHAELLYHINLGWPLLDSCAQFEAVTHDVTPRDKTAHAGIDTWDKCEEPQADFVEQCFYHDIPEDAAGMAEMSLVNTATGLKFTVSYRKKELPFLTQWKNFGMGEYVCGIEPGNCHVEGAAAELEKYATLKVLQPGESFETLVRLKVSEK